MVPYRKTIPGTKVSFEMVPAPGGTFRMRSQKDALKPSGAAEVVVTIEPFWLGRYEVTDVMLEQWMNSFDLDGDGGIGGEELTPEAQQAMDDWASDTGRSLAIFTGLPLTAIWAAICSTPLCVGEWVVRRLIGKRNPEVTSGEVLNRPFDDGNPYISPGSG